MQRCSWEIGTDVILIQYIMYAIFFQITWVYLANDFYSFKQTSTNNNDEKAQIIDLNFYCCFNKSNY